MIDRVSKSPNRSFIIVIINNNRQWLSGFLCCCVHPSDRREKKTFYIISPRTKEGFVSPNMFFFSPSTPSVRLDFDPLVSHLTMADRQSMLIMGQHKGRASARMHSGCVYRSGRLAIRREDDAVQRRSTRWMDGRWEEKRKKTNQRLSWAACWEAEGACESINDEQLPARVGAVDNAPNHRLQVESARHTEQHHHQLSISALQVRGLPNRWVGGQIPH